MTLAPWVEDPSQGTADDGPAGDMHPYLESDSPLPTAAQSFPHDHHGSHIIDWYLEFDDQRSNDASSADSSDTETLSSQNDGSVVTGPTGSAPSYNGHDGDGKKEIITVSSFDGLSAVDLKATANAPRPPGSGLPTMGIRLEDNAPGLVITPRMNSSSNWDGIEHSLDFLDSCASATVRPDVKERIALFDAELDSKDMQSTSGSDSGCDSVPNNPPFVATIRALSKGRNSFGYTTIYNKASSNMGSSHQMREILSPSNLKLICALCQLGDPDLADSANSSNALVETQYNTVLREVDVVSYLFELITPVLDGAAPKIECSVRRLPISQGAALRFGLNKEIVLHHLKRGEPIKFICCYETFPHLEWAKETIKAFLDGAEPWSKIGLKFKHVDRKEPAHFRIAFSLFPKDLDCSVLAQAFFPGEPQPDDRTLWVYLMAFHPQYRAHLAGYMSHEAGHIGASRHSFDESHNGMWTELKSVTMGPDNPKSVMNYHDDPADFVIQSSDIRDMGDMYGFTGEKFKGFKIRKVVPADHVYDLMPSFEFVMKFLRGRARGSREA